MQIDVDGEIFDVPDDASVQEIDAITSPPQKPGESRRGRPGQAIRYLTDQALAPARAEAEARAGTLEAGVNAAMAIPNGIVRGGASLLARATGHDPAAARAAVEPYTYKPSTETGQKIVSGAERGMAYGAAPIAQGVQAIDTALGEVSPAAQDFTRKLGGTVSDVLEVLPAAPAVSKGLTLARTAARTTADAAPSVAKTLAEKARAGGLRLRPSDVDARQFAGEKGSVAGHAGEFVAGHDELARDFVLHNKTQFNNANAEYVGLPKGSPMGPEELAKVAAPRLKVYETLRKELQPVPMDEELRSAILGVDRGNESLLPMPASLAKMQEALTAKETVTPGNLIDTISDLRRQGFKGAASETPDIADLGLAQVRLADNLEKQLDAMVARQKPSMVGSYQDARQGLARIHTLEATNVAGEVDPAALARLHKKTDRSVLTGAQAYTADMAEAFPKVVTMNVPHAKPIRTGGGDILTNTLKVVAAPVRLGARGLMRATRGEAAVPQTGLGRALADYYKGEIKPGRGVLKLEPPSGAVGDLPAKGTLPPNQADRTLLGPGHDVSPGQEGLNFGQPTDAEAMTAPFEGTVPHRPMGQPEPVVPRGLALASGRDRIPASTEPTRGRVLRRSVAQANAAADKLSLEGRMEVPDGRKTPSTDNLRLEGGPIEGKLPTTLEDLQDELAGRLSEAGWTPDQVKKALDPKLRKGGALSIPEGRVNGLQAPVDWEWKPDDVTIHVLPFDPSDKAAITRFLRGQAP